MVRLVLFDIDGTLIQTGGAGMMAFGRAFATSFNIANGTERLSFAGRTDTGLAREFFQSTRIEPTPENFRQFFDTYVFWLDFFLHGTTGAVCPGVARFIQDLRLLPQPPAIGLLTGNIRLGAEIKLRHYGLWDEFQTGAFADDHEDRDQIAAIAHRRGGEFLGEPLHGDQVLVIGDTPLDIRCGRAIKARVLAVGTGGATMEQLQANKPDWLVEDLNRISVRETCL